MPDKKTERKMPKRDPEVLALERCKRILDELTPAVAGRVVRYLSERVVDRQYGGQPERPVTFPEWKEQQAVNALNMNNPAYHQQLLANQKLG